MAGDDPVTALYIGRHLGVGQQLKFRGALSVKPHAHKIVEYGHGTSRQNTNEFYAKNGQIALALPTFLHMYPHNQRLTVLGSKSKSTRRRRIGATRVGDADNLTVKKQ
jgi:hypothetical protein